MKLINEYLEEQMRIKPLGVVTTDPHEADCGEYTGEDVLIDGKDVGIVVYYIDYINWLEKRYGLY